MDNILVGNGHDFTLIGRKAESILFFGCWYSVVFCSIVLDDGIGTDLVGDTIHSFRDLDVLDVLGAGVVYI